MEAKTFKCIVIYPGQGLSQGQQSDSLPVCLFSNSVTVDKEVREAKGICTEELCRIYMGTLEKGLEKRES